MRKKYTGKYSAESYLRSSRHIQEIEKEVARTFQEREEELRKREEIDRKQFKDWWEVRR